jgi:peptidoglycan/xylan/chitin deacetylase (PgdA/CDA1 family)
MSERLVLNFHGLGAIPHDVPAAEAPYWCPTVRFGAILDEVAQLLSGGSVPIQITFDDGNLSDATIALPALVARGLTATFFVCAGRIGHPGFLDASAMREMLAAGMAIGSHGWHHVDWRRIDDETLVQETRVAIDKLSAVTGLHIDEVGIPFGSYDRRVLNQLRRIGVRFAFTSDGGRAPLSSWLVPRQSFVSTWNENSLRQAASGRVGRAAFVKRAVVQTIKRLR